MSNVVSIKKVVRASVPIFAYRFKAVLEGSRALILDQARLNGAGVGDVIELLEEDFEDGETFSRSGTGRVARLVVARMGYAMPGVAHGYVLVEFTLVESNDESIK